MPDTSLRAQRRNPARHMLLGWIAASLTLLAMTAYAADKPVVISADIRAETAYGEGELRKFFIKIYDASLWTDAQSWSPEQPYALSMHYDLDVKSSDIVDSTVENMKDKGEGYRSVLAKAFPDIKKGDRLTALFRPGKGTYFFHNDTPTAHIADKNFAAPFFGIWLSEHSPEPKLRRALLHRE